MVKKVLRWCTSVLVGLALVLVLPASVAGASAAAPAGTCDTAQLLGNTAGVDQVESNAQQDFFDRLNALRRSKGLSTLVWNEAIAGPAADWSATMSAQDWLHHARDVGSGDGVSPSQDYVTINSAIVANWTRLAENVGVSSVRASCSLTDLATNVASAVAGLHDAFVASPGHYANMVGDFNQVGIGVHIDADQLWVTVRFAKGDLPQMTSSAASYIDATYHLFLGRHATWTEKLRWAPFVMAGQRSVLTGSLAVSDEWAGVRVNELYQTVLGRNADPGGRAFWVSQIAAGMPLEAVAANMYGSSEYFRRSGGTNRGFVAALYDDILHRRADSGGLSYWKSLLDAGAMAPSRVAGSFYASVESRRDRVASLYAEILGRRPDPAGQSFWADQLLHMGDIVLATELASSKEFFDRAT